MEQDQNNSREQELSCLLLGEAEEKRLKLVEKKKEELSSKASFFYRFSFFLFVFGVTISIYSDNFYFLLAAFIWLFGVMTYSVVLSEKPCPETYMGVDIYTARHYTVKRLFEILWDTDTLFGTPGIAWIQKHGKALLYGPTEIGVFVFVVPSFFRKKISVRLMTAPSRIEKYGVYMPAYTVEINERLKKLADEGDGVVDFEAFLGPMAAEIARLLNESEELF